MTLVANEKRVPMFVTFGLWLLMMWSLIKRSFTFRNQIRHQHINRLIGLFAILIRNNWIVFLLLFRTCGDDFFYLTQFSVPIYVYHWNNTLKLIEVWNYLKMFGIMVAQDGHIPSIRVALKVSYYNSIHFKQVT